jgi:hypothetical protein
MNIYSSVKLNATSQNWTFEKQLAFVALQTNGLALENLGPILQKDREVVLLAVGKHGRALEFANGELQGDKEVVSVACIQNPSALEFATYELRSDVSFALELINHCSEDIIIYMSPELRKNKELMLAAVNKSGSALKNLEDIFKADEEIVRVAIKKYFLNIKYAHLSLLENRDLMLKLVSQTPSILVHCGSSFRKDPEFILDAARLNLEVLEELSWEINPYSPDCFLKGFSTNIDFLVKAVRIHKDALKFFSHVVRDNERVVRAAIEANGLAFKHAGYHILCNKEIALIAIGKEIEAFNFVDSSLKEDRAFVLDCIENISPQILQYAPFFQGDEAVVSSSYSLDPSVLKFASKEIQEKFSVN